MCIIIFLRDLIKNTFLLKFSNFSIIVCTHCTIVPLSIILVALKLSCHCCQHFVRTENFYCPSFLHFSALFITFMIYCLWLINLQLIRTVYAYYYSLLYNRLPVVLDFTTQQTHQIYFLLFSLFISPETHRCWMNISRNNIHTFRTLMSQRQHQRQPNHYYYHYQQQ